MSKKSNRRPVGAQIERTPEEEKLFVSRCIDNALGAKRWDDFEMLTAYVMKKTKGIIGRATADTMIREALTQRISLRKAAIQ